MDHKFVYWHWCVIFSFIFNWSLSLYFCFVLYQTEIHYHFLLLFLYLFELNSNGVYLYSLFCNVAGQVRRLCHGYLPSDGILTTHPLFDCSARV